MAAGTRTSKAKAAAAKVASPRSRRAAKPKDEAPAVEGDSIVEAAPAAAKSGHELKKIEEGTDEQFIFTYGGMFTPVCSCGAELQPRSTEDRARAEFASHLAEA